jgi:tRNA-dihydrouridine synthase A
MAEPDLVARCVEAMRGAVSIPTTVKARLGIDDHDSYEGLCDFISRVASRGCTTFILHARKAWLKGLSLKENREIPPLRYEVVHQIKRDFPGLEIIINGGFTTLDQVEQQLHHVDGVMIGREAYHNPYLLAEVDHRFYGDTAPAPTRLEVLQRFESYVKRELSKGTALHHLTRHILGLLRGQPGARQWRQYLSTHAHRRGAGAEVIEEALRGMASV